MREETREERRREESRQTRKTFASSNPKIGNLSFMNLQNSRRLYQNKLIRRQTATQTWELEVAS